MPRKKRDDTGATPYPRLSPDWKPCRTPGRGEFPRELAEQLLQDREWDRQTGTSGVDVKLLAEDLRVLIAGLGFYRDCIGELEVPDDRLAEATAFLRRLTWLHNRLLSLYPGWARNESFPDDTPIPPCVHLVGPGVIGVVGGGVKLRSVRGNVEPVPEPSWNRPHRPDE